MERTAMFDEFIAIDTETTVLSGGSPRVVEIGLVHVKNERVILRYEQLIDPGCPLFPATEKLTGITREDLDQAPPMEAALPVLEALIGRLPLVGHHLRYDLAALRSSGLDLSANPSADTMLLYQTLKPEAQRCGLEDVCADLNVHNARHHRALADAEAAAECYLRLSSSEASAWPQLRRSAVKALRQSWDCGGLKDLSAYSVAVTGVPSSVPEKQDLEDIVTATGATLKTGVSGKTSFLVVCDRLDERTNGSLSGKHEKALELIRQGKPIRIISEKEFLIMSGFTPKTDH